MPRKTQSKSARQRTTDHKPLHDLGTLAGQLTTDADDDLRIDKIMEIRQALHNGEYDLDARVQDLLGKLETNLGQLVQNESQSPPSVDADDDACDANSLFDALDDVDDDAFFDEFESLDALNDDDRDDFDRDDDDD